jgi:hypothetical protein
MSGVFAGAGGIFENLKIKSAIKDFEAGKITKEELSSTVGKETMARLQQKSDLANVGSIGDNPRPAEVPATTPQSPVVADNATTPKTDINPTQPIQGGTEPINSNVASGIDNPAFTEQLPHADEIINYHGNKISAAEYANKIDEILPNDKTALQAEIDRLEKDLAEGGISHGSIPINIQFFAAKRKLDRLLSNSPKYIETLINRGAIPESKVQEFINSAPDSIKTTNKETVRTALENIQNDRSGTISKILSNEHVNTEVDNAAGEILIADLYKSEGKSAEKYAGDIALANKIASKVSSEAAQAGRSIQILTQTGALEPAKIVTTSTNLLDENIKPDNKKILEDEAKGLKKKFDNLEQEAAPKVADELDKTKNNEVPPKKQETPDEILAKKIENATKPKEITGMDTSEKAQTNRMVQELYTIAKKTLPENTKLPQNPYAFVAEAVRNREKYSEVWNKAKEILQKKYANDDGMLSLLDEYLGKNPNPVFDEMRINRIIKTAEGQSGVSISNIVKDYYANGEKNINQLSDFIIQQTGLNGSDAEYLAGFVKKRINELVKAEKVKAVNQLFRKISAKIPTATKVKKSMIDKITEGASIGAFEEKYYKQIADSLGVPNIDTPTAMKLVDLANKLKTETDIVKKQDIQQQIVDVLATRLDVSMADKLKAVRMLSMLTTFTGRAKDFIGNSAFWVVNKLDKAFQAGLEKITMGNRIDPFTGEPLKTLDLNWRRKATPEKLKAIDESWLKNKRQLKGAGKTDILSKNEILRARQIFKNPAAEGLRKGVNSAMDIMDNKFLQSEYKDSLGHYMSAKGLDAVTPEAETFAMHNALEATYRVDNAISEGINKLVNSSEFTKVFGSFAMPFVRTPSNLLIQAFDHTPFGLLRLLKNLDRANGGRTIEQNLKTISKAASGTSTLFAMGVGASMAGVAYGKTAFGSTDEQRNQLNHKQNYSVDILGYNITLDWAQPVASPFFAGVAFWEAMKKTPDLGKALYAGAGASVDVLLQQGMLQSMLDLFNSNSYATNPLDKVSSTLSGYSTQFVPTAGGQVARTFDPYQRNTYDPDPKQKFINTVKNKVPLASKTLPIKYDSFGNPLMNGNAIQNFLVPAKTQGEQKDPIINKIVDLSKTNTAALPIIPDKKTPVYYGQQWDIPAKDYAEYSKRVGELQYQEAQRLFNGADKWENGMQKTYKTTGISGYNDKAKAIKSTPQWKTFSQLTDAQKADVIHTQFLAARDKANAELLTKGISEGWIKQK